MSYIRALITIGVTDCLILFYTDFIHFFYVILLFDLVMNVDETSSYI